MFFQLQVLSFVSLLQKAVEFFTEMFKSERSEVVDEEEIFDPVSAKARRQMDLQ